MSGQRALPGLGLLFFAGLLYGASMGVAIGTAWHPVPFISGPGVTATVLFVVATALGAVALVRAWRA